MRTSFATLLATLWARKWWILAPTVVTALLSSVLSYYLLPARYRSETTILVMSPRVSHDVMRVEVSGRLDEVIHSVSQQVLSRVRLERIIREFGLYQHELGAESFEEVVMRMRRNIQVELLPADEAEERTFRVGFISSDPKTTQRVTERLASLYILESSRQKELLAKDISEFIDSQIEDVRRRIIEYEKTLEELRANNRERPLAQADLLPYEVLKDAYKSLLVKAEEARMATHLERRQLGETFRVLDGARVPERPVSPNRSDLTLVGTIAGLALGLTFVIGALSKYPSTGMNVAARYAATGE